MKRIIGCLCLALTACMLMGAMLPARSLAEEQVTLRFTYWGAPGEKKVIDAAIASFESAHPNIKVDRQHIPDDFNTKFATMVAGNNAPDVTYMNGFIGFNYAQKGVFLDIRELAAGDPDWDEADVVDGQWYDWAPGKSMGPLQALVSTSLVYNVDMFVEAGLPMPPTKIEDAWTWDEFVQVAKRLTLDRAGRNALDPEFDPSSIKQYGINFPNAWFCYLPLVASNGGSYLSEDGAEFGLFKPEAVEALQQMVDLVNVHHVAPSPVQAQSLPAPSIALQTKKVAMSLGGSWEHLELANTKVNWGVAVLPVFKEYKTCAFGGVITILSSTQHPEEAWELYKWLNDPEKVIELHQGLWMPQFKSWYADEAKIDQWITGPARPEGFKTAMADPVLNNCVESPEYHVRNFAEIDAIVGPALEQAWLGKKSVQAAFDEIKAKVEPLIQGRYDR